MAKETKKSDFQITRSLQLTLQHNPKIKEVYFNEAGDHFFNKHEIEVHEIDADNHSTGKKTVMALPGAIRQPVKVQKMENRQPVWKDVLVNVSYSPIAATFSREEILSAPAVGDRKTEAQKLEILRQAAEIAKDSNMQDLLDKINKGK